MSVDDDDVNVSNGVVDDTVVVAVAAVVADVLTDVDSTTVIRNTRKSSHFLGIYTVIQ